MPLAEWAAGYLPDYILEHLDLNPVEKAGKQVAVTGR
jgi:hypothetical protein